MLIRERELWTSQLFLMELVLTLLNIILANIYIYVYLLRIRPKLIKRKWKSGTSFEGHSLSIPVFHNISIPYSVPVTCHIMFSRDILQTAHYIRHRTRFRLQSSFVATSSFPPPPKKWRIVLHRMEAAGEIWNMTIGKIFTAFVFHAFIYIYISLLFCFFYFLFL